VAVIAPETAATAASGTTAVAVRPWTRPWRKAWAMTRASTASDAAAPINQGVGEPGPRTAASPPTASAPSRTAVIRVSHDTRWAVARSAPNSRADSTGATMIAVANAARTAVSCNAIASGSAIRLRGRSALIQAPKCVCGRRADGLAPT